VQGEIDEAIVWYKKSVASQNDWPQFHHICYWELYWSNMFKQDWWQAMDYGQQLLDESKWSRCMYAYQKAATMCMVQSELTPEQKEEQLDMMR
jgi:hypothetical protein